MDAPRTSITMSKIHTSQHGIGDPTVYLTSTETSTITRWIRGRPGRTFVTLTKQLPDLAKASFPNPWQTATGANLAAMNKAIAECLRKSDNSQPCFFSGQRTSTSSDSNQSYTSSILGSSVASSALPLLTESTQYTLTMDSSATGGTMSPVPATTTIYVQVLPDGESSCSSFAPLSAPISPIQSVKGIVTTQGSSIDTNFQDGVQTGVTLASVSKALREVIDQEQNRSLRGSNIKAKELHPSTNTDIVQPFNSHPSPKRIQTHATHPHLHSSLII